MKTILTAVLLSCSALISAQTVTPKDKAFIEDALQGGLLEVKLGELSQAKASSTEVKTFGQHMISDHSKANSELIALAQRKNVVVPVTLNEKGQKIYDMLAEKNGADFDKAYTKCMVKDHKKDICEFKKEAKKGDDVDLKGFASSKITTLEHHKQMAKDARKALKMGK